MQPEIHFRGVEVAEGDDRRLFEAYLKRNPGRSIATVSVEAMVGPRSAATTAGAALFITWRSTRSFASGASVPESFEGPPKESAVRVSAGS